jgi:hypothetical protein
VPLRPRLCNHSRTGKASGTRIKRTIERTETQRVTVNAQHAAMHYTPLKGGPRGA